MVTRKYMIGFLLATLGGICLHFLYDFFPAPVFALFSPVKESIWEHMKLIFVPYLIFAFVMTRGQWGGKWKMHLTSLWVMCLLHLAVGYLFYIVMGQEMSAFDLSLYVIIMGIGFILSSIFQHRGKESFPLGKALPVLTALLAIAFVVFTFFPPEFPLFADLTGVRTWVTLPC